MGQHEVYEFLKKNPEQWFTSKRISNAISISIGSVTMSLKRLREKDEVLYQRSSSVGKAYRYKYKE